MIDVKTDLEQKSIKEVWILDRAIIKIYYTSGVCDSFEFKKRVPPEEK